MSIRWLGQGLQPPLLQFRRLAPTGATPVSIPQPTGPFQVVQAEWSVYFIYTAIRPVTEAQAYRLCGSRPFDTEIAVRAWAREVYRYITSSTEPTSRPLTCNAEQLAELRQRWRAAQPGAQIQAHAYTLQAGRFTYMFSETPVIK